MAKEQSPAYRAAESVARTGYGRLVAWLAAETRDIAAAQDALGDALCAALAAWATRGVPEKPEAWLLTAARRRLSDARRHGRVAAAFGDAMLATADIALDAADGDPAIPDRRLELMFACAHPAIDEGCRAPLMLQAIFGLDAARIAAAFNVSPAAMSQRLVRAKAKIRDAGIALAIPGADGLAPRLDAVLQAIYAAYGSGWDDLTGADPDRRGLAAEAIWLARLTAQLLPGEPEAAGLLALLLHCEARRSARRDRAGCFVPLSEQDPALWSRPMMAEAERLLAAAAMANRVGRFQLEAAIQSAHVCRLVRGAPGWDEIVLLYRGLVALAPSAGARVGYAAALAESAGPAVALGLLDTTPDLDLYQPHWALRAELARRSGDTRTAEAAYRRAIDLAADPAVRDFLAARRDA